MPNHIINKLKITGDEKQVKELINKYSTHYDETPSLTMDGLHNYTNSKDEYGRYDTQKCEFTIDKENEAGNVKILDEIPTEFKPLMDGAWTRFPDFEKIKKCPESLHIDSNGDIMPLENKFSGVTSFKSVIDEIKKHCVKDGKVINQKRIDNFIAGINNYIKYDHATWYSWNIDNWGTKWNSYDCEKVSNNEFIFETAWSNVSELLCLIKKEFANVDIFYEYSDEDTGQNCGSGFLPECMSLKNGSKEAYELAFKLRPDHKEDYKLIDGEYKYIEE